MDLQHTSESAAKINSELMRLGCYYSPDDSLWKMKAKHSSCAVVIHNYSPNVWAMLILHPKELVTALSAISSVEDEPRIFGAIPGRVIDAIKKHGCEYTLTVNDFLLWEINDFPAGEKSQ